MENRSTLVRIRTAVMTSVMITALVMFIGLPAQSQSTTCDDLGFPEDNKVESSGDSQVSGEWGHAEWQGDEDTTLDVTINEGWTVEICVKAGGGGPQTFTVTESRIIDVGQNGISHVSWRDASQSTATSSSSTTSSTTTTSSTSTTATTSTTSTTSTTIGAQVEQTSTTSTIKDEVLGTTITTSTTSTTIEDEVLDNEVLPFTGFGGEGFGLLALAIISAGLLFLVGGRSIER